MKLAVIGEPCIDYIYRANNPSRKQLGGIMYSVISLAIIADEHEIYPILNLGEDQYEYITSFMSSFKNIRTDFIFRCSHKTRLVHLYYRDSNPSENDNFKTYDREESSSEAVPPLNQEIGKIDFNSFKGVLVNFISGIDITLEAFKKLRKNFRGYIHSDMHNLVMRTSENGKRIRKPLKNWQSWCNCSDTIQMNEAELSVFTGSCLPEEETVKEILNQCLCNAIIITKGTAGATIYTRKDKKDFNVIQSEKFVDSTGCGDVFATAFFYSNLINGFNYYHSMEYALRIASRNTALSGVEELKDLLC